ncbi:MAG TPA: DUF547 domain-containing protein [Pirellulales bacterium]|nr:DUF547 domain-containing protein [Pirellulales bacterium]
MKTPRFIIVSAVALWITSPAANYLAAPWTVGRKVAASQQVSMDRIDHIAWDALLKKYVDANGNVDYTGWKRSSADIQALDGYLNTLSQASTTADASKTAKLAFWINSYNAVTVKGILREYPTTSIRNHTAKVFGYNIWKELLLVVGGDSYSLEDIEHKILRKMGEPRIHFAIVCASRSCPPLSNEAYTAQSLEQQIATNTRTFFANPQNFRYGNGTFHLSSIMDWFASDFGSNQAAQLQTISPYLPDRAAQQAAARGSGQISYLDYDWGLNDQKTARTASR